MSFGTGLGQWPQLGVQDGQCTRAHGYVTHVVIVVGVLVRTIDSPKCIQLTPTNAKAKQERQV